MPQSILLVDDDDSLRLLMTLILKRAGYIVYEASSATDALELIRMTVPSLCIIDVMMPGTSGFELSLDLRENPRTACLPIILLSARSDRLTIEAAKDCGANLFLTKPVPAEALIATIEHHLRTGEAVQWVA